MCVGFLYTVVTSVVGTRGTRVSMKGKYPSWFGSSAVNCLCGSCELMCWSIC